jgi:hypothetical protein
MSQLVVQPQRFRLSKFFTRQFDLQRTKYQDRFDVLFGVVLPVLCFEFDPLIFKGNFLGEPLAGDYQLLVYAISTLQITAMVVWLTCRDRLKSFSGPIAGVLFLGGLFSLVIGVILLPVTLIGLFFVIGLAGFAPFFTGIVYLRNGVRGFKSHEKNYAYTSRFSVGIASALIALTLPIFVAQRMSVAITDSVSTILQSDIASAEPSVNTLRMMPVIPDKERRRLVVAHVQETDPTKREFLRHVYFKVTGESVESWHTRILAD